MVIQSRNPKNKNEIISSSLDDEKIIWLRQHNKYLVARPPVDKLIKRIYQGDSDQSILDYCFKVLGLDLEESNQMLKEIRFTLSKELESENRETITNEVETEQENIKFTCRHTYLFNNQSFLIEYQTPEIEHYIHPKFAHLTTDAITKYRHHFQLFEKDERYYLKIDGKLIGSWEQGKVHFLSGKVSMEILQKITHTKESDWLGVFHAAGVALNNKGILFLGDSGNGKSTLAAILMASGFDILADDFLPVLTETKQMYSFPAAISVKKPAIEMLSSYFPELKNTKEYNFSNQGKTVRYLANPFSSKSEPEKVFCKALVFVKYEPGSTLMVQRLPKSVAFQKLVPDSWISSEEKNARQFMNWFANLPCWQITYSNNASMIETVKRIFEDRLS